MQAGVKAVAYPHGCSSTTGPQRHTATGQTGCHPAIVSGSP